MAAAVVVVVSGSSGDRREGRQRQSSEMTFDPTSHYPCLSRPSTPLSAVVDSLWQQDRCSETVDRHDWHEQRQEQQ